MYITNIYSGNLVELNGAHLHLSMFKVYQNVERTLSALSFMMFIVRIVTSDFILLELDMVQDTVKKKIQF